MSIETHILSPRLKTTIPITRRHYLKVTAATTGGLLIGFYLPDSDAASIQPQPWTSLPQGAEINAWLAIDVKVPGIQTVIALNAQPGTTEGRRRTAATPFPA